VTPLEQRRRAVVLLYLRTGSRFETADHNGLSHFVEHMLFRGTDQHPSAYQLAQAFEELGGTLDASTAADHGTLGISLPPQNLDAVLPLLAEVYQRPLFADIELERGIIREEIHEELGEHGKWIDPQTLARKTAFDGSALGQPILGNLENIERFDAELIRSHHQRTYVGNRLVVSIAGPVDVAAVQARVRSIFAELPRGAALASAPPPSQTAPRFCHVPHTGASQTRLSLGFRCAGHLDSMEPGLDMLMRIIDDGMATRLYHRLCDQRGLCYTVSGGYEAYHDVGILELEADTAHENAPAVVEQMLELCSELSQDLISDREFERARKRATWQHEALTDDAGETADFMAMSALMGVARTPGARLARILAVSKEEIRDAAARTFTAAARSLVAVGSSKAAHKAALEKLALTGKL